MSRITEIILENLSCPKCGAQMRLENGEKSLMCASATGKHHCFDISADGYVNLSLTDSKSGDSKEAVRARTLLLDSGAYEKISDVLNSLIVKYSGEDTLAVDAGCGEGYYSCRAAKRGVSVLGVDISKNAVAYSAKRAKRESLKNTLFSVSSVFDLPINDASAGVVFNVFAPCAEDEYSRVLRDDGTLIVVHAGPDHLMGLKRAIYDTVYENEERADLPTKMTLAEEIHLKYDISLESQELISALFAMTPYYWRTSVSDKDKLVGLDRLDTEIDIIFSVYKKTKELL